ncbi:bifunctional 4-hydroxy-3-methylbut-2-enyl diphosphate reductase/30S ribosomal protein S1 [Crassaminicella profunda]|uniref:bifunctional 4-hydroxy-3-methylbut-2-enyl diphosphate reductase/30S ribosomal protein S1 n=1 Tax=Crassaminicella profunda TaxID=1286698 RepID=UPI001CA784CA|nr:bifunctional 4-hydroxy-3-methylbut-2-enyl diphosphate reductase/30S ribosomal protein S1 [Crassaminicella profunda]QZY56890.1 bifunctional 4-hydroxy-3-methylbut-2-enyl diphosphate reductase/30S ribosomal protein S1 [Crassaminicella profunda]
MKIIIADNAGFCFGVKQAMNKTINAIGNTNSKKIYTYGPLIHNNQVINKLEGMGVSAVENLEDAKESTLIIRSHGVPIHIYDLAKQWNIEIIDATCPFVRKVQKTAKEYYDQGYTIIIIGNPKHPEVIGINGWCNNNAYIVQTLEDIDAIKHWEKICVVAQTTITLDLWNSVVEKLNEKATVFEKFNTICTATKERQKACGNVAKEVDAMIVIGGYHSSNTQKLVQIGKKYCKNTYHIETADELPIEELKNLNKIGVTAGASTPDWIIKEAIEKMNNMEHENNEMMKMMEEIENSLTVPRRGNTVNGTVIHVTDKEIMVNIGYKSDGIIPKHEISNDPLVNPHDIAKEGDPIEAYVLRTDDGEGNILLSKKRVDAEKYWENLEEVKAENKTLKVKVLQVVKGGVIAAYKEITGFIPASQLSTSYVDDLQEYVGKELHVKIIDLDFRKKKVVFSRRVVKKEENEIKRRLLWESIEKGKTIEGEVKRLADFGAFVDIGGMDGLVHISDLSWGRVNHPKEVVKIGDKIKVVILDFDKEKNRISLGLKQTTPEPWGNIEGKYNVGDIVDGKVVKLVDFGAFVELEPGVDGLVHISQIADRHIAKASEEVHVGQTVKVKILDLNKENKRISLSMKEAVEGANDTNVEIINEDEPTTIGEILESKE